MNLPVPIVYERDDEVMYLENKSGIFVQGRNFKEVETSQRNLVLHPSDP
jgi:hypothetical protein